jgi:actin-related protein
MNSSVLSLFATGRTRGIVLESGHGVTSVSPIFEGFALPHAQHHMNIAGEEIGKQLLKEITDRGIKIDKSQVEKLEIIKFLKEKMCAVALDFDKALKSPDPLNEDDRSYELPDGNVVGQSNIIQVDHKARFSATEILFKYIIITHCLVMR